MIGVGDGRGLEAGGHAEEQAFAVGREGDGGGGPGGAGGVAQAERGGGGGAEFETAGEVGEADLDLVGDAGGLGCVGALGCEAGLAVGAGEGEAGEAFADGLFVDGVNIAALAVIEGDGEAGVGVRHGEGALHLAKGRVALFLVGPVGGGRGELTDEYGQLGAPPGGAQFGDEGG